MWSSLSRKTTTDEKWTSPVLSTSPWFDSSITFDENAIDWSSSIFEVPESISFTDEERLAFSKFVALVFVIRQKHWQALNSETQESLSQKRSYTVPLPVFPASETVAEKPDVTRTNEPIENFLPEVYSSSKLVRWIIGYKFSPDAAINQLISHLNWRRKWNVDACVRDFVLSHMMPLDPIIDSVSKQVSHVVPELHPDHSKIVKYFPVNPVLRDENGALLLDKSKNVICIERTGLFDDKGLLGVVSDEEFFKWHVSMLEFRSVLLQRLSVENGRLIKFAVIMDLAGFSTRCLNTKTLTLFRQSIQMAADNYPEGVAQIFFVNTPKIFTALWFSLKGVMTQRTLDKVVILDNRFEKTLLEYFDPKCLPPFLGGSSNSELADVPRNSTDDRFSLGEEKICITIPARKKEIVTVSVEPGSVVCWTWGVLEHEIAFSVKFKPSASKTNTSETINQSHRYHCSKLVSGSHEFQERGVVIFTWDNSWGLLQSRHVQYKIDVGSSALPDNNLEIM